MKLQKMIRYGHVGVLVDAPKSNQGGRLIG